MRILVTGGAGFVGSWLVEHHLKRGDEVLVLDDFSTGDDRNLALARVRGGDDALRVTRGSVCDAATVRAAVAGRDVVYHLAAAVGVGLLRERPLDALHTNRAGVDTVLAACVEHGAAFVFASSSEVYGDSDDLPFCEDQPLRLDDPRTPRTGYAIAKAHGECAAFAHAVECGLRVLVVRLFNTVGPRQRGRYGMVLPRFVDAALRGEPLTVFGDGRQSRCFAHVGDVCAALVGLVEREAWGEVFNLGSDHEVSIGSLARLVLTAVGRSPRGDAAVRHVPFAMAHPGVGGDVRRRVPDLAKARTLLGSALRVRGLDSIVADVVQERRGRVTPFSGDAVASAP